MREIDIGEKHIGPGRPCYVIAEAGVNHNGDIDLALRLVTLAARSGADAIKFQTFSAERLAAESAPKADYQKARTDPAESQLSMLKKLELSRRDHERLLAECARQGITFLSSAFDEASADMLEELDLAAFKVPSGEITNLPFLKYLAAKGRCLIVSTGMSDLGEVETAVSTIQHTRSVPIVLLHCVSLYPSPARGVNLKAMETMRRKFDVPVGYSDHTEGTTVALAAVALGAAVIEKHFTSDRSLPGPDHAASLEPDELQAMIEGIRSVEAALGDGVKAPLPEEAETAAVARKSLIAATDIPAGSVIRRDMIAIKRPGSGLSPAHLDAVVGRTAQRDIKGGSLITAEML
jgi:N,N'-diacetyllegionaminate synthase